MKTLTRISFPYPNMCIQGPTDNMYTIKLQSAHKYMWYVKVIFSRTKGYYALVVSIVLSRLLLLYNQGYLAAFFFLRCSWYCIYSKTFMAWFYRRENKNCECLNGLCPEIMCGSCQVWFPFRACMRVKNISTGMFGCVLHTCTTWAAHMLLILMYSITCPL